MRALIGRKREANVLQKALTSHKSELIVVYGRRRVGKTFLIHQVYENHIQFELSGLHNGTLEDQLEKFHGLLLQKSKQYQPERPQTWIQAFFQLETYINRLRTKKKKVIFLDEFPWLATRRSKFLMAFDSFWNSYANLREDLVVVVCGSAASYMVNNLVRNKGGLHNRISHKIKLLPFTLQETAAFLKSKKVNYSQFDILKLYMAIGGIPHYLEHVEPGESVAQAIDRLCFQQDGPLRNEFDDVFASLFENYERHEAIVKALASSRKGLTRTFISKKSKIPTGGRLSKALKELTDSGFIERYPPFQSKKKDSLYRLRDEYSLFYLKFIQKNTEWGAGTWLARSSSQSYKVWLGFSFETVCLKHIDQIKEALGISAIRSNSYSWLGKNDHAGTQVDLLIDRADNVINLCEIKFHQGPFALTKYSAAQIRQKIQIFRESTQTRKTIFFTMLTSFGVKNNPYSLEVVQNDLTMDCLFVF